jgi:hypothetical protein
MYEIQKTSVGTKPVGKRNARGVIKAEGMQDFDPDAGMT